MKRSTKRNLTIGAVAIVSATVFVLANPLRRSDDHIRGQLLRHTPLGTNMTDVRKFIESKGWKVDQYREDVGFLDQRTRPNTVVGKKHIRAELGAYQDIPWRAYVTVFWGFDEQSRLIDIWVWKAWDAL